MYKGPLDRIRKQKEGRGPPYISLTTFQTLLVLADGTNHTGPPVLGAEREKGELIWRLDREEGDLTKSLTKERHTLWKGKERFGGSQRHDRCEDSVAYDKRQREMDVVSCPSRDLKALARKVDYTIACKGQAEKLRTTRRTNREPQKETPSTM